ncbi:MAG: hypothetical protein GC161_13665 [Planctomycetaceae bacterium]|nr:hypothetical protein [Planctomycetaceae bacterium]
MRLLAALLALLTPHGALAAPADTPPAANPSQGDARAESSVTWRGSSTLELAAKGAFVREGEERREVHGFVLRQTERAEFEVLDRVLSRVDGRAIEIGRHFARARTSGEVVEPVGRTPFERRSRLEGKDVVFSGDAEGRDTGRRFAEPDGDANLLAGLEAPLDARDFGIVGPLELGRRIPIPANAARHLFLPFGHLRTDAEAGGGPWQPLLRRALLDLDGELFAVVERLEQREGGTYAHLRLAGTVGSKVQEPKVEDAQRHGIDLTFRVEAALVVGVLDRGLAGVQADLAVELVRRQEVTAAPTPAQREIEFEGRFQLELTRR